MKPLNTRFKLILKYSLIATALIVLLLIAWLAYINFHGDEVPDAGRDAFYARSYIVVPDNQNIAVAISGINAPMGKDIVDHGRYVIDIYASAESSKASKAIIAKKGEIELTIKSDELFCWFNDAFKNTPDSCASPLRVRTLLAENKLHLARYADLQKLPYLQGAIKNVMPVIHINELMATKIKLGIDDNQSTIAYQKWLQNHHFIEQVLAQDGDTLNRKLFLLLYEKSLNTLEFLLFKSPNMIKVHGDELLAILKPSGLEKYNLKGMMQLDNNYTQQGVSKMGLSSAKIHPEYIANRRYRAQMDILKEANKIPFKFEEGEDKLYDQHYYNLYRQYKLDWLNPLNSLISNYAMSNVLRSFSIAESMHSANSLAKLLNLKIKIHHQNIADADIQTFLNNAGSKYFNPFTNKPMRWDAVKSVLICDKPNSDKSAIEVRL